MYPIYLDTETTGVEPEAHMVQLAYKNSETGEVLNEYFNPGVPISFGSMAVHHITNEMVADKPTFEGSEIQTSLQKLLQENILVAHNALFDIGILKNDNVETHEYIDTLRVARHMIDSEAYSLQYLRYSLGLKIEAEAHDAWGDILVLEGLFNHLRKVVVEKFSLGEGEDLQKMIELTKMPVLLHAFTFGKHKGKTFAEVSDTDLGYLEWLYNSETSKPESEQNEDMVYTLKNYLN